VAKYVILFKWNN